ncbi:MAG: M48 family metallopeptidase [Acidiferrobacterales bacterium]
MPPTRAPLEHQDLAFDGACLHYTLRLSPRRATICVQILPGGEVRVAAPAAVRRAHIDSFLRGHWRWIRSKQQALRQYMPAPPRMPFGEGAQLPLLGEKLILRQRLTTGSRPEVVRCGSELVVSAATPAQVPELIVSWYRNAARCQVSQRIGHFAALVGRSPARLSIRGQKTRWGSCSALGTISINWRLMQASAEILDYVIVHELCHLLHRNHSPRFWREVGRILPDYMRLRCELRTFGLNLPF